MGTCRRIYVDFDDVLCQTAEALRMLAAREYGRHVPFDRIHSFNIGVAFDLSDREVQHVLGMIHAQEHLEQLHVMEGALSVLGEWSGLGYEIAVVTGRPPSTRAASETWLESHGVPYSELLFVDKYARLHADPGEEVYVTLEAFRQEKFLFAVDDSPEMVRMLDRMGVPSVLFDRPWNARARLQPGVTRCRTWAAVRRHSASCLPAFNGRGGG